jgi:hypothetical protein
VKPILEKVIAGVGWIFTASFEAPRSRNGHRQTIQISGPNSLISASVMVSTLQKLDIMVWGRGEKACVVGGDKVSNDVARQFRMKCGACLGDGLKYLPGL